MICGRFFHNSFESYGIRDFCYIGWQMVPYGLGSVEGAAGYGLTTYYRYDELQFVTCSSGSSSVVVFAQHDGVFGQFSMASDILVHGLCTLSMTTWLLSKLLQHHWVREVEIVETQLGGELLDTLHRVLESLLGGIPGFDGVHHHRFNRGFVNLL
jgi:hypothetical protein